MTPEQIKRVMELVRTFGLATWKAGMWSHSEALMEEHGKLADATLAKIEAELKGGGTDG